MHESILRALAFRHGYILETGPFGWTARWPNSRALITRSASEALARFQVALNAGVS